MASYMQSDSTNISVQPESGRGLFDSSRRGWFDMSWPSMVIIAVFAGLMISLYYSGPSREFPLHRVYETFTRRSAPAAASQDRVLVVTANADRQLQVIATLSPRGFDPLLAGTLAEVTAQLAAHPGAIKFAVVDTALRDSAAISARLSAVLPTNRIVTLRPSYRRETIGPILLNRL